MREDDMINMDISNYTELNEEDKKGIEEYLQSMYPDENIQLVEKNDVFTDAFFQMLWKYAIAAMDKLAEMIWNRLFHGYYSI